MLKVSSQFDAGNIEVIDNSSLQDIQLQIRKDHNSDFYQWFYFRVQGGAGETLRLRLLNAAEAAYPDGWDNYQAVASYDRQEWFRVPTRYNNGELIIEHTPEQGSIYYAYFAPYSFEQHLDLIAAAQQSELCDVKDIGSTLDGRDINLLRIASDESDVSKRLNIWVTARQHPGETMAEWFVEGMLERLLDEEDALAADLLKQCTFWVVPNMNPDGAVRGHLRTNAAGVNLNREWQTPTLEKSPEVFCVREQMMAHGVDLFLDIHGDEALPCNFIAGQAGAPDVSAKTLAEEEQFKHNLRRVNPDFQLERGYEPGKFGPETLTIASFWVGDHFHCPAMTLEMPFKDHDERPDPVYGWSAERSRKLGASMLNPIKDWLARR
ncbi:M14 family metallopeptidase [Neptunomonas qingdaonensis]|uniref:Murein tripeptide amidase MpaA n=1 Tax=Neptunomonas qingdaonensis TaxID=1045558 RepID=A0A1I2NTU2_9GAMM|nr:M14-type cytosolic carboxypeptidase [Neptunomonas qingdaonensis]SFG05047.1 Murein tripeptide amidase MpaA [Neptunomonas qingdaonensis]